MFPNKWLWRVWIGLLICVGCEVIFWRSPFDRSLLDWVRLGVGYGAIGAVTLDILARYRVRDLAGILATVLCVVPVIGLMISSENTLVNLPTHLFSRILGLHGIGLLWALGVWVGVLDKGYSLRVFGVVSLLFGVMTALWIQVADDFMNWSVSSAQWFEAMIAYLMVGGLIGAGGYLARRYPLQLSDEVRLSSLEWGVMIFLSIGLMVWADAFPSREAIGGTVILSAMGVLIVWFEDNAKSQSLLTRLLLQSPPEWSRIMTLWALGGIGLLMGWFIPLNIGEALSPVGLLEIGIVLFGFSWMPILMLWVGIRALSRRSWRLDIE